MRQCIRQQTDIHRATQRLADGNRQRIRRAEVALDPVDLRVVVLSTRQRRWPFPGLADVFCNIAADNSGAP
ncbi:hypothetical protein V1282_006865 [Nitrobacteraceae bacterium AZCC 2146]|jgi:hypothetical protein